MVMVRYVTIPRARSHCFSLWRSSGQTRASGPYQGSVLHTFYDHSPCCPVSGSCIYYLIYFVIVKKPIDLDCINIALLNESDTIAILLIGNFKNQWYSVYIFQLL